MDESNAPINKLVVGLDGSEGSAHGLKWAIRVARGAQAEVIAVYATPYAPELPDTHVRSDEVPQTRNLFEEEWCAPLRAAQLRYRTVIADTDPDQALMDIAQVEAASMIVVGSRGLSGFRAALLGSVSHRLVEHASLPVAVVPPPQRELPAEASKATVTSIVIGLDGSQGSMHALDYAIRLARALDAEVIAVFAKHFEPYAVEIPETRERTEADQQLEKEFEDDWCEPLRRSGTRYRTVFAASGPAQALMDTATKEDADMIVVGSRGRGGLAAVLLGSVSHQVLERSAVPVVVVPPAERERAAEEQVTFHGATQLQPARQAS